MKIVSKNILAILALAGISMIAQAAATAPNGYLVDTAKDVVKSGTGLCWHTGTWTPADATVEGCDGKLAKAAPTAAAPTAAAPTAAAPTAAAPTAAAVAAADKKAGKAGTGPGSDKVTFEADALFAFDKSVLQPAGKAKLEDLVSKLQGTNIEVIIARGHTDSVGTDAYNQKLSLRRAASVKAFLVSKGVPADRIFTEGKGEKQPVASNKTSEGRAKNRRVEVEVVSKPK